MRAAIAVTMRLSLPPRAGLPCPDRSRSFPARRAAAPLRRCAATGSASRRQESHYARWRCQDHPGLAVEPPVQPHRRSPRGRQTGTSAGEEPGLPALLEDFGEGDDEAGEQGARQRVTALQREICLLPVSALFEA